MGRERERERERERKRERVRKFQCEININIMFIYIEYTAVCSHKKHLFITIMFSFHKCLQALYYKTFLIAPAAI
jgi:hypothetical protein